MECADRCMTGGKRLGGAAREGDDDGGDDPVVSCLVSLRISRWCLMMVTPMLVRNLWWMLGWDWAAPHVVGTACQLEKEKIQSKRKYAYSLSLCPNCMSHMYYPLTIEF
jgi:hypothetical protein